MESPFNRYLMLAKRWAWVIILGVVVCGGTTYVISKSTKPTYQATSTFFVNIDPANPTSSTAVIPTYAQLLTNPLVLNPVVAKHRGMTLQQLNAMITVKPLMNVQLIELDVRSDDPSLASQVANEVGQSYLLYASSRLPGTVQMLPVQVPSDPIAPKPLRDAGIAALIGLGLAVTLSVIFEWVEDRLSSPENARELLAQEILTSIPWFPKRQKPGGKRSAILKEKYRMLAASLNTAQTIKPFKVVMVTSALPGEGKSTVAANLAALLAMTGRRVLLVDANLHQPVLGQRFQLDSSRGLSTALLEMSSSPPLELYGQATDIPTLRVLTSGSILTDSAELLQSSQARQLFNYLQNGPFDYVVVDGPAFLSAADAQILALLVQAVLLVVDVHKTQRKALQRMKRVLGSTRARILGIALNRSPWTDYAVSQHYQDRKTQSRDHSPLLMSPAVSASHPMRLMLPFTPVPASWSKPPDSPLDDELSDTQQLRDPSQPVNREISTLPTDTLGKQEQRSTPQERSRGSNNPKKQL